MNIKKISIILLLILFLGVSIYYFVFEKDSNAELGNEQEPSGEAVNEVKDLEEEGEKKVIENEVYVAFKKDTDSTTKKELFNSLNIEIIDTDAKNDSYLVSFKQAYSEEDLERFVQELKSNENITFSFINDEAVDLESQENKSLVELSYDNFSDSMEVYGENSNTFIKPNENFTFLYPASWSVSDDYIVTDQFNEGEVVIEELEGITEDTNTIVEELLLEEHTIEGDVDIFLRDDGSKILKWVISNGESIRPQAVLITKSGTDSIYFNANYNTEFSQFALIVDSFTVK